MASIGETGELLRRSTVQVLCTRKGSAGSGIIWSSDGTVVTNAHVADSESLSVELWDGRRFAAEIQDRDLHRDLAKLRLAAIGLPAAKFRSTPALAGEAVIAVGNPLGFTGAISTGVVRREGRIPGFGQRRWVQAAIRLAPGNSGGPLADLTGEILGMNTMIMSGGIMSGGIALAIPGATVENFIRHGSGPRLGVTVRPVRSKPGHSGLLVLEVQSNSPAERASLLLGDVLTGAGPTEFRVPADLGDALAAAQGTLRLRFLRGDKTREREVVVRLAHPASAAA